MGPIGIRLLGGFLLEGEDGRAAPPIPAAAARSLFAYLVTNRARSHTRDLLAGTFWPDLPESSARRRLSQALWQIHTALQEVTPERDLIRATTTEVAFAADHDSYRLDVAEFDRQLQRAARGDRAGDHTETTALEIAVDLYRGEFLAGIYDDWTVLERERLRIAYLSALDRLTSIHKSGADYEKALGFAKRLSLSDPLRESAHREVMRLCFLLGRSNEALQQYDRCAAILAEELGTAPSSQTEDLKTHIAQLRAKGTPGPFAPTSRSPLLDADRHIPLVGRDEERVLVLRRMEEAILGRGGVVFVEGRSGIGKTRLIEELIEDALWRGLSVLRADCVEAEVLYPLHALRKTLDGGLTRLRVEQLRASLQERTLTDLARIVPSVTRWLPGRLRHSAGGDDPPRERVNSTLHATLLALAKLNPIVLIIDDAQWIDEESITVLADLARELDRHGVLVCLSYRPGVAREREGLWLRLLEIDAAANAEKVRIDELDLGETARLIEDSIGVVSVDPEVVEGLFLETGGNPLFLLESLRAWHERTQRELGDDIQLPAIAPGDLPVAGGVVQVIRTRFADLSADEREVLEVAALLETRFDPVLVGTAVRLGDGPTLRAFAELIRRGALVERDLGFGFSHDQIRKVVVDAIPSDRLRRLHRRIMWSLQEHQPDRVEALAHHATAAGLVAEASTYSLEAARRARALGAYSIAAKYFERAADWGTDAERFHRLCEWEDTLDVLGHREEQREVLGRIEALARSRRFQAELARRQSRLLAHDGKYLEAISKAEEAVAAAEDGSSDLERGLVLQNLGLILSHAGRPTEAAPHLEAALEAFGEDGSHRAAALCDLGSVLCDAQRYERAAAALVRARRWYAEADDLYGTARVIAQLAIVRMEQGDGQAAVDLYDRALQVSRELDYRRGEAINLANLGNALYFGGTVGKALECYAEATRLFDDMGDRRGAALVRANAASVRHTIVGDESVEDHILASLDYFAAESHEWGQAFCHELLAAIAHGRGDTEVAQRHIAEGIELLTSEGHRWVEVHLLRLKAEVHLADGALVEARAAVDRALALCADLGLRHVAPTVHALAAVVALAAGDQGEALTSATAAVESLHARTEQAYIVWYRRYLVANAAGRSRDARRALTVAVDMLGDVLASLSPEDRASAKSRVLRHREILDARDRTFDQLLTLLLPRRGTPLGRPVRPEEWAKVDVTVSAPSDFDTEDTVARRRVRLCRVVAEAEDQGASPRVADLAAVLRVSVSTIRRDLAALREAGTVVHTRGSK